MALKDRKEAQVKEEVVETVIDVEAAVVEKNQEQPKAAKPAPTKEVAVKKAASAPAVMEGSSVCITCPEFLDVIEGAQYGDFPSIVYSNGNHMINDPEGNKVTLGERIKFMPISEREVFKLIPGDNSEAAKEHFASADTEEELMGALEDAKDDGYEKASIKRYLDIYCILTYADKNSDSWENELVVLQLAPSSVWGWNKLYKQIKFKLATGKFQLEPVMGDAEKFGYAAEITSTATPTSFNGNSFTKATFGL